MPNDDKNFRAWLDERFQRIYDKITALEEAVTTRMDDMDKRQEELEEKLDQHGERLTTLERYKWLMVGVFGLATPVIIWAIIQLLERV